jgi:hypothetical protein
MIDHKKQKSNQMKKGGTQTCFCQNLKLFGDNITLPCNRHLHICSHTRIKMTGFEIDNQEEFGFFQTGIASFDLICFKCKQSFQLDKDFLS